MRIDWWTLGLQAANVLVLVFILSRFLFRPVVAVIEARQAAIANLLAQAEAEKAAARGERDKAAAEAERNAAARSEVLEAAAAEAGKLKAAVLASAREEADHLRAA